MLIHCSNRRQTHAGLLAAGAVRRVWKGHVGSCRVRSGKVGSERAVFLFLDFGACIRTRFLAVFAEYQVNRFSGVCRLPRSHMRFQIRCQRESWDLSDDRRAAVTICLIGTSYYITDFGAFALEFRGSVQIWDGNSMAGGIHGNGG